MKIYLTILLFAILFPKSIITTIAGGSRDANYGRTIITGGIPVTNPNQVTVDKYGNIYIAEEYVVRKLGRDGSSSIIAGTGSRGYSGDGGLAINARLLGAADVAVDNSGNVYIADFVGCMIRKVNPLGIIYTIAGNGQSYSTGDGGPAILATVATPIALAIDVNGNLLVAERHGHCVRSISPSGIITTIAGNGEAGFSGDGGPAINASLNQPTDVAVDADGNVYIADCANNRIRKITRDGIITTIAGTKDEGYDADGTPAIHCRLTGPYGIFVDGKKNIYFSDNGNAIIRVINNKGIISTIAGTPQVWGYSGDNGAARKGKIKNPGGVALTSDGSLLIADFGNNAIRKVTNAAY